MVAGRIRPHNHRGHHNQEEVLVRNLVRIATGENFRLGRDKGEIRIANLIRHVLRVIWFLKGEARRSVEGELKRGGWWSVLTKIEDYK